jgi:DNA primase
MTFRDRVDVEKLLQALGVKYERRGRKLQALCPNPDHQDSSPSWAIVDSPGASTHAGHHCFSCKFGGGPWELVMAVRGVDEAEAFAFMGELVSGVARPQEGVPQLVIKPPAARVEYVLPRGVQIPSIDGSSWPEPFAKYLEVRGVTQEQIDRWSIGFAKWGPLAWRVVIPVHTRGRLVAHVARSIFRDGSKRYDMPTKGRASPTMAVFGEPLIDPELGVLTIAEGSFSMLALERAGAPNPVALLGSDWSPAKAAILTAVQWSHVIVATDPDMAGDKVARAISASFRKAKISRLRMDQSPDDCELGVLRARTREVLAA